MDLFKFSHGNAKIANTTMHFALPAGITCPGAKDCMTHYDNKARKIVPGPGNAFLCYAAIEEFRPNVRAVRDHNLQLVKDLEHDQDALNTHLAKSLKQHGNDPRYPEPKKVRWFTSGDCYSTKLRDAIIYCAEQTDLIHYLYTKNLPIWRDIDLPDNLRITASWGGRWDHLIEEHFPRNARVLNDEENYNNPQLPVDSDDSLAYDVQAQAFALKVHGNGKAGSFQATLHARRRLATVCK